MKTDRGKLNKLFIWREQGNTFDFILNPNEIVFELIREFAILYAALIEQVFSNLQQCR